MSEDCKHPEVDNRWNLEISRLAQVLDKTIDPDDPRLTTVKDLFPVFENLLQADPKALMRLSEVNLDPENPQLLDAFNKGKVISSSMLLLSLIKTHLKG